MVAIVTPAEAEQRMRDIAMRGGRDPEIDHGEADRLLVAALRALGYDVLCDLYEQISKWYA